MSNPFDGSQLCAQTDTEVFFPRNNFRRKQEIKQAIDTCNRCPLKVACRAYADKQNGTYGVWGGKMYSGAGYISPVVVIRQSEQVA